MGVKLFSRVKRRVLMTEEAQMLLPSVISAFSSIQDAVEVIREQDAEQTLTVSLTPQFASNWLYIQANSNSNKRIETQNSPGTARALLVWLPKSDDL